MPDGVTVYDASGTCPNCGERYESWIEVGALGFSQADITNTYRAASVCIDRETSYTALYIHGEQL